MKLESCFVQDKSKRNTAVKNKTFFICMIISAANVETIHFILKNNWANITIIDMSDTNQRVKMCTFAHIYQV